MNFILFLYLLLPTVWRQHTNLALGDVSRAQTSLRTYVMSTRSYMDIWRCQILYGYMEMSDRLWHFITYELYDVRLLTKLHSPEGFRFHGSNVRNSATPPRPWNLWTGDTTIVWHLCVFHIVFHFEHTLNRFCLCWQLHAFGRCQ